MSRKLAALVVLGCVAAAQGRAMNPCNETACSDSRCQWNTGAGQCEFKDELGRECAKIHISAPESPAYCAFTHEGTYRYFRFVPSYINSCFGLPESHCKNYHCKWRPGTNDSRGYCRDDTTIKTPCDEAGCNDSRCQLNNGECEFKTKIERMCAIQLNPSKTACPHYCSHMRDMRYNYCKAVSSPSCDYLPKELCGAPHRCKWYGHRCMEQVSSPCDEAGCTDSRCRLNNGECEFKTKIGRVCAWTLNPSRWNCPNYCSFVRNATYNYCQERSGLSCSDLPFVLCGEPHRRCEWYRGECKNQRWSPCDEAGCNDSRCQLNNGTCEFKTKIGRECAKVLFPSYGNCPNFCTYVSPSYRGEGYQYCKEHSQRSCYSFPEHLCEDNEVTDGDCEWSHGYCSTKTSIFSSGVIAAIGLSSLCIPALCFAVVMCLLCCVQHTTKQVVTKQPVQMGAVAYAKYVEGAVPAFGIPVDGCPQDAPPASCSVKAVAVPVKDAHPTGPSPPAC